MASGEIVLEGAVAYAVFHELGHANLEHSLFRCLVGEGVNQALADAGIDAADVGEVVEAARGTALFTPDGERPLEHPGLDPFWGAFGRWSQEAAGIAESG